jgi:hypothetical protein
MLNKVWTGWKARREDRRLRRLQVAIHRAAVAEAWRAAAEPWTVAPRCDLCGWRRPLRGPVIGDLKCGHVLARDPVHGREDAAQVPCRQARAVGAGCGPSGAWWQLDVQEYGNRTREQMLAEYGLEVPQVPQKA